MERRLALQLWRLLGLALAVGGMVFAILRYT